MPRHDRPTTTTTATPTRHTPKDKDLTSYLAPKGIRVNTVAPGPVWTPLIAATMPPDQVGNFGADTPLGRAGQPAELAPAYVFLASQESSYITGERIGVTGGEPLS